jgi:hypothetical protein
MNATQMAPVLEQHDRLRKLTEIPYFYGKLALDKQTAPEFLDRIDVATTAGAWNDDRRLAEFRNCLRGSAAQWYHSLANEGIDPNNWAVMIANFKSVFNQKYTAHLHAHKLQELTCRPAPGQGSQTPQGEKCRYCKKPGHRQKDCRSRIAARAPCVDQNGVPYKSAAGGYGAGRVHEVHKVQDARPPPPTETLAPIREVESVTAGVAHLNW